MIVQFDEKLIKEILDSKVAIKAITDEEIGILYDLNKELFGYKRIIPFEKNVTYWKTENSSWLRRNCNLKVPVITVLQLVSEIKYQKPSHYECVKSKGIVRKGDVVNHQGVIGTKEFSVQVNQNWLNDRIYFKAIFN